MHSRLTVLAFCGIGLFSCVERAPLAPDTVAANDFSHDHYCPIERVHATPIVTVPAPPHAIARDPERLALWTHAKQGAQKDDDVAVTGCGEIARYKCWVEGGYVPVRRGRRYVNVLTACVADSAHPD